jgi:hypothetical protein
VSFGRCLKERLPGSPVLHSVILSDESSEESKDPYRAGSLVSFLKGLGSIFHSTQHSPSAACCSKLFRAYGAGSFAVSRLMLCRERLVKGGPKGPRYLIRSRDFAGACLATPMISWFVISSRLQSARDLLFGGIDGGLRTPQDCCRIGVLRLLAALVAQDDTVQGE